MNQWCGINSLAYFLPITFERNIGLSTQLSLIISGILGIQYFLVSWLLVHSLQKAYQNITNILPSPYFFIERLGRRKMLMSSAAACCFCMLMISVMLAFNTTAVGLLIGHRKEYLLLTIDVSVVSMGLRSLYLPILRCLFPRNPAGLLDVRLRDHAPSYAQ